MPRLAYLALAGAVALGGCIVDTDDDRGRGYPRYSSRDYDHHSTRPYNEFFAARRRVVCDEGSEVCYRGGKPSRKATRREFGKKAARRFDDWGR